VDDAECHTGDGIPPIMDMFPNHSKWNFLDEKRIVNGNTLPKKVHMDPLTGYVDAIPVSGDFRDAHNIFAVVSGNPTKKSSIPIILPKRMAMLLSLWYSSRC
jgi:hypothetical protein